MASNTAGNNSSGLIGLVRNLFIPISKAFVFTLSSTSAVNAMMIEPIRMPPSHCEQS